MDKTQKKEIKAKAKEDLKNINKILKSLSEGDFIVAKTYTHGEMKKRIEAQVVNPLDYEEGVDSEVEYGSRVFLKVGISGTLSDKNESEYIPSVDIKHIFKVYPAELFELKDEWGFSVENLFVGHDGSLRIKNKLVEPSQALKLAKLIMRRHGYKISG